jgi:protein-tyrosine phosphatase
MAMTAVQPRHVRFEACFNFRDLGGYRTRDGRRLRWKTLYRSDTLHRLTPTDAEVFSALGLQTVIDLRSVTEVTDYGRLSVGHEDLTWHSIPMLDDVKLRPRDEDTPLPEPLEPGEGYMRILEEFGGSVGQTFKLLAAEGALPAVFHCTSGKDRTGIVAALTLDLLGVPDDVIGDDYLLTELARPRSTVWIEANEPEFAALLAQIPPERRTLRAEMILGLLARVRTTYGSVADFLSSVGVTDAEQDALRQRLLED